MDSALEVINDHGIDVIDTGYLIPYGIVGYMASKMTGIPYILRHGGSDVVKFLRKGVWNRLLPEVIRGAAAVITDEENWEIFGEFNEKVLVLPDTYLMSDTLNRLFLSMKFLSSGISGKSTITGETRDWVESRIFFRV